MYDNYQVISYNFRLGFALSNRHHLHRAYLVTVRFHLILSVYLSGKVQSSGENEEGAKFTLSPVIFSCFLTLNDFSDISHLFEVGQMRDICSPTLANRSERFSKICLSLVLYLSFPRQEFMSMLIYFRLSNKRVHQRWCNPHPNKYTPSTK